jgi:hypothetical protein
MLVLRITANSQITLDFQSPLGNIIPIKLATNEAKYFYNDYLSLFQNNTFSLYNLDGSLYKIIQMPPQPTSLVGIYGPYYISRTLFDNDPSNIEYVIQYNCDSVAYNEIRDSKVIREDGTILLDELYGSISMSPGRVYATEEGTKLMLSPYLYANGTPLPILTKVFNLPGEIPTSTNDIDFNFNSSPLLYPNPNNGSFVVNLNKTNSETAIIEVYSISGKLISTFNSTSNSINVNELNLPNGMYFLNIKKAQTSQITRFIIQK